MNYLSFPGGSDSRESACNVGELGLIHELGRSLEKGTATHSSVLAWRTPWTEEPGRLQFMGSQTQVQSHEWAILDLIIMDDHLKNLSNLT